MRSKLWNEAEIGDQRLQRCFGTERDQWKTVLRMIWTEEVAGFFWGPEYCGCRMKFGKRNVRRVLKWAENLYKIAELWCWDIDDSKWRQMKLPVTEPKPFRVNPKLKILLRDQHFPVQHFYNTKTITSLTLLSMLDIFYHWSPEFRKYMWESQVEWTSFPVMCSVSLSLKSSKSNLHSIRKALVWLRLPYGIPRNIIQQLYSHELLFRAHTVF